MATKIYVNLLNNPLKAFSLEPRRESIPDTMGQERVPDPAGVRIWQPRPLLILSFPLNKKHHRKIASFELRLAFGFGNIGQIGDKPLDDSLS